MNMNMKIYESHTIQYSFGAVCMEQEHKMTDKLHIMMIEVT